MAQMNPKHEEEQQTETPTKIVSHWSALGTMHYEVEDYSRVKRGQCPYSKGITWEQCAPGVVIFNGEGVLEGRIEHQVELDGRWRFWNCFGEYTSMQIPWDSEFFGLCGDYYAPNTWLRVAHIDEKIMSVDSMAFCDCINLKMLVVHGQNTELKCLGNCKYAISAPLGSQAEAEAEAKKYGVKFYPLESDKPFAEYTL